MQRNLDPIRITGTITTDGGFGPLLGHLIDFDLDFLLGAQSVVHLSPENAELLQLRPVDVTPQAIQLWSLESLATIFLVHSFDESIRWQGVARCREYARGHGLDVVLVDQDAGISGASRHDRPGLLSIMERIGEWDALLVWDGSRIARNLEDFGWVLNLLEEHEREGYDVMANQPLARSSGA